MGFGSSSGCLFSCRYFFFFNSAHSAEEEEKILSSHLKYFGKHEKTNRILL
jgi:hypothetical protein